MVSVGSAYCQQSFRVKSRLVCEGVRARPMERSTFCDIETGKSILGWSGVIGGDVCGYISIYAVRGQYDG
jgi:hypothetical protein